MGFVHRELARLQTALHRSRNGEEYHRLYAAQQALFWAIDPGSYRSPCDAITDTQEGREDYRRGNDQTPSSSICGLPLSQS